MKEPELITGFTYKTNYKIPQRSAKQQDCVCYFQDIPRAQAQSLAMTILYPASKHPAADSTLRV